MKEATGELNMTVVVVVAIGVMASFFFGYFWPNIVKPSIENDTLCNKAKCKTGSDNISNGKFIVCTYTDSNGQEKTINNKCPYKG